MEQYLSKRKLIAAVSSFFVSFAVENRVRHAEKHHTHHYGQ